MEKKYKKDVTRTSTLLGLKAWYEGESKELEKWIGFGFFNHIFVFERGNVTWYYNIEEGDKFQEAAVIFVSGRVSYEIVAKTHRAGIPFLVAVSAPSSLAVEMCENLGITLVGFCRGTRATVYTHAEAVQYSGLEELHV